MHTGMLTQTQRSSGGPEKRRPASAGTPVLSCAARRWHRGLCDLFPAHALSLPVLWDPGQSDRSTDGLQPASLLITREEQGSRVQRVFALAWKFSLRSGNQSPQGLRVMERRPRGQLAPFLFTLEALAVMQEGHHEGHAS